MVTIYGMSEHIKNISLKKRYQNQLLGYDSMVEKRSEKMEQVIDDEVLGMIENCYKEAKDLLIEKRKELDKMAGLLLEQEVLNAEDVKNILGKAG